MDTACIIKGKGILTIGEIPTKRPGPGGLYTYWGEVKIAVHRVGICGTDVMLFKKGLMGDLIVSYPFILGHESAGVVYEVGEGVSTLKVGDRVAAEPGVSCRSCDQCITGRYNTCTKVSIIGVPNTQGALTRHLVHPVNFCHKLPDNISMEEGALLEPLSVAVHGCRRAGVTLGDKVLICGAGSIGLLTLLVAKSMGSTHVCLTDSLENRLQVARELGADQTVMVKYKNSREDADTIVEAMGSRPDVTIVCRGLDCNLQTAVYATRHGGVVVNLAAINDDVSLPMMNALLREVDIRSSIMYPNCYPKAISLLTSGKIDLKPIITHRFPLEESEEAFETALNASAGTIKVMIDCEQK